MEWIYKKVENVTKLMRDNEGWTLEKTDQNFDVKYKF